MASGLTLGLMAFSAPAQQVSDAELLRLFEAQRDAFRQAEESGMGRTRGLTLVPLEGAGNRGGAAEPPVPGSGATASTGLQPREQLRAEPEAPLTRSATRQAVFGQLARELQVNVRIEFAFDSADLSPAQKPLLEQLCRVMKASNIAMFRIVGHTDAAGSDTYNERLSILRAEEVRRYFVTECGIDPARLEAVGMGERFPYDAGNPHADANRRVEFQALS
jgi:outer membrane protein OmpA-like peptidoglycan-associated protein